MEQELVDQVQGAGSKSSARGARGGSKAVGLEVVQDLEVEEVGQEVLGRKEEVGRRGRKKVRYKVQSKYFTANKHESCCVMTLADVAYFVRELREAEL